MRLKSIATFVVMTTMVITMDQLIKYFVVYTAQVKDLSQMTLIKEGKIISIVLVFNTGISFSLLSEFSEYIKYVQTMFVFVIVCLLAGKKEFFEQHHKAFALIVGGGASNTLDRFTHGGVVDYIYYHYGFDFPIFNAADVMINIGVLIFTTQNILSKDRIKRASY